MITELAWYIQSNRYTNIAQELESSIRSYADAKNAQESADVQSALREQTRSLFEKHAVMSGLRKEDESFINIDTEFFTGTVLEEKALDLFLKNIIKAHCYQKVLWEYMGTTGKFTQITKTEMMKEGKDYSEYVPLSYKKNHPLKKPLEQLSDDNTLPLYVYSDGSVSPEYNSRKARFSFNTLEDTSGFNWNKGYDPNDEIKKDDWTGTWDEDGTWVKMNKKNRKTETGSKTVNSISPIRLIMHEDTVILYDPDFILLNPAVLLYYTQSGEAYGSEITDIPATVSSIEKLIASLGEKKITAVVSNNPAGSVQSKEIVELYKKILKGSIVKNPVVVEKEQVQKTIKDVIQKNTNVLKEKEGISLEKKIENIKAKGLTGERLEEAVISGSVPIPVSLHNKQDASGLGLTDDEYIRFEEVSKEIKEQNSAQAAVKFDTALLHIFYNWASYAKSSMTKTAVIDAVYKEYDTEKSTKSSSNALTTEMTFEELINGTVHIPGIFTSTNNSNFSSAQMVQSFIHTLTEENRITKEQAQILVPVLTSLPEQGSAVHEKVYQALKRVLYAFKPVIQSTGMKIDEVVYETVKAAGGVVPKKAFTPPVTGFVTQTAVLPVTAKRIFFDLPLSELVTEAQNAPCPVHEVSLNSLYLPVENAKEDVIVIGGAKGESLYHVVSSTGEDPALYSPMLQNVLRTIKFNGKAEETYSKEAVSIVTKTVQAIKKAKSSITESQLRQELITRLEKSKVIGNKITYNLLSKEGAALYLESAKHKETGLTQKQVEGIINQTQTSFAEQAPKPLTLHEAVPGILIQKPVMVSSAGEQKAVKRSAKGILEKIHSEKIQKPFIGQEKKSSISSFSLAEMTGITGSILIEEFGYSPAEAEKAEVILRSCRVHSDEQRMYAPDSELSLLSLIRTAAKKGKTAGTFKKQLEESFKSYPSITFDLAQSFYEAPETVSSSVQHIHLQNNMHETYAGNPELSAGEGSITHSEPGDSSFNKGVHPEVSPHTVSTSDIQSDTNALQNISRDSSYKAARSMHNRTEEKSLSHKTDAAFVSSKADTPYSGVSTASSMLAEQTAAEIKERCQTPPLSTTGGNRNNTAVLTKGGRKAPNVKGDPSAGQRMQKGSSSAAEELTANGTSISAMKGEQGKGKGTNVSFSAKSMLAQKSRVKAAGHKSEEEKLRKIEANYIKDTAMLAKEKAPALARSDTHEIGHAEGSGGELDRKDIKQLKEFLGNEIKEQLIGKL